MMRWVFSLTLAEHSPHLAFSTSGINSKNTGRPLASHLNQVKRLTFQFRSIVITASLVQNTVDVPPNELVVLQSAVQIDSFQRKRLLARDQGSEVGNEKSSNEVFHLDGVCLQVETMQ